MKESFIVMSHLLSIADDAVKILIAADRELGILDRGTEDVLMNIRFSHHV